MMEEIMCLELASSVCVWSRGRKGGGGVQVCVCRVWWKRDGGGQKPGMANELCLPSLSLVLKWLLPRDLLNNAQDSTAETSATLLVE